MSRPKRLVVHEQAREDELLPRVQCKAGNGKSAADRQERHRQEGLLSLRRNLVAAGKAPEIQDHGVQAQVPAHLSQWVPVFGCTVPLLAAPAATACGGTSSGTPPVSAMSILLRMRAPLEHKFAQDVRNFLQELGHADDLDALVPLPVHTLRVQQQLTRPISLPPKSQQVLLEL